MAQAWTSAYAYDREPNIQVQVMCENAISDDGLALQSCSCCFLFEPLFAAVQAVTWLASEASRSWPGTIVRDGRHNVKLKWEMPCPSCVQDRAGSVMNMFTLLSRHQHLPPWHSHRVFRCGPVAKTHHSVKLCLVVEEENIGQGVGRLSCQQSGFWRTAAAPLSTSFKKLHPLPSIRCSVNSVPPFKRQAPSLAPKTNRGRKTFQKVIQVTPM